MGIGKLKFIQLLRLFSMICFIGSSIYSISLVASQSNHVDIWKIGDSAEPILLPIDGENVQLFFRHMYCDIDAISEQALQMTKINDTWSDVTRVYYPIWNRMRVVSPSFGKSGDFHLVHYSVIDRGINMRSYVAGQWRHHGTIVTREALAGGPIWNIRAVLDSQNQTHLIWERKGYYISNGIEVFGFGLFYSTYAGEPASNSVYLDKVVYPSNYNTQGCDYDGVCFNPLLAIDPDDQVYLTWFNGSTFFTTLTPDGATDPIRVFTTPYSENLTLDKTTNQWQSDLPLLDFKINSKGELYFFYAIRHENSTLLVIKYANGQFTQFYSGQPLSSFAVDHDSTDTFHLAYMSQNTSGAAHLYYQTFKDGFSSPVLVTELGGRQVDIALDMEDTPHIAWQRNVGPREIFYTYHSASEWREPTRVTNGTVIDQKFRWYTPPPPTTSVSEGFFVFELILIPSILLFLSFQRKKTK